MIEPISWMDRNSAHIILMCLKNNGMRGDRRNAKMTLEEQFHHAMIGVYENARDCDHFATYFKQMIDQYSGLNTAKRLLAKAGIQEGLMKLWELGLLKQSMEALVIQERFRPLFTEAEIAEARRRLSELGYFK
jgi:hypothetical protein